ncbi:MAG: ISKra4 family transposase [Acidobacteriota bacterium]|nr:ISKra4 family transposase [Acidobacteriota bacterium]
MAFRSALHRTGAAALTQLLRFAEPAADQREISCGCGQKARYHELRARSILTALGEAELMRPYYLCPHCHHGQFPVDAELNMENKELSPGVGRMLALVGADAPFDHGRQQIKLLADLKVTTKAVERNAEAIGTDLAQREQQEIQRAMQLDLPMVVGEPIPILYIQMDATGVPVVKSETEGRQGHEEGQPPHTRQAKLGCAFTQTTWDEEGYAARDSDSTTYVAAIETAQDFGKRLYLEAWKRGWSRAEKKVFMGDGAECNWNIAEQYFHGATEIVDLYHAREHLWDLVRKLHPNDKAQQNRWIMIHRDKLDEGLIEDLVQSLRSIETPNSELTEEIRVEANYFEKNAERMRYPKFRRQHLFVGTGVIEAGCKTLIGSRCKQSGMFWTVRGANSILALRCCIFNGRFENYCESRIA